MSTTFWNSKLMWWGVVIGVLSGIGVYFTFRIPHLSVNFINNNAAFLPGLCFGLFTLGYFFFVFKKRIRYWRALLWLVMLALSFYAAFIVTAEMIAHLFVYIPHGAEYVAFAIGGLLGGAVVLGSFRVFVAKISRSDAFWLLALATAIAVIATLIPGNIALFIFWQTAVLLILGHALWTEQRKKLETNT